MVARWLWRASHSYLHCWPHFFMSFQHPTHAWRAAISNSCEQENYFVYSHGDHLYSQRSCQFLWIFSGELNCSAVRLTNCVFKMRFECEETWSIFLAQTFLHCLVVLPALFFPEFLRIYRIRIFHDISHLVRARYDWSI